MKQLIRKIFILMFTLQFAYGAVGFGLYGYQDFVSTTPGSTSSGDVSVTPSSLENPYMGGFYIYIDAIPFVDFQADFEFAGNTYNFTSSVSDISSEGEFPLARASQYYSLRKKIVGVSVPFLQKLNYMVVQVSICIKQLLLLQFLLSKMHFHQRWI